jgi:heterodisulfide reductase subunit B
MKYAFFIGCNIPARVQAYESSARAVMSALSIEPVDIREFNCCGYPMANSDPDGFLLSAAKNLACAERLGLDVLALCKCCFGTLKRAAQILSENPEARERINHSLAQIGLEFSGRTRILHFLSVLYHEVGIPALKEKITAPYKDLKIAVHYGCHALRPSAVTGFDDPVSPVLFDALVEVTGAKSVPWPKKLECCGAPQLGIHDDLSYDLARKKIADALAAGADYLATGCPWCQLQFDVVQKKLAGTNGGQVLGAIVYPQLLGLAMGMEPKTLGLETNAIDISGIATYLNRGVKENA